MVRYTTLFAVPFVQGLVAHLGSWDFEGSCRFQNQLFLTQGIGPWLCWFDSQAVMTWHWAMTLLMCQSSCHHMALSHDFADLIVKLSWHDFSWALGLEQWLTNPRVTHCVLVCAEKKYIHMIYIYIYTYNYYIYICNYIYNVGKTLWYDSFTYSLHFTQSPSKTFQPTFLTQWFFGERWDFKSPVL